MPDRRLEPKPLLVGMMRQVIKRKSGWCQGKSGSRLIDPASIFHDRTTARHNLRCFCNQVHRRSDSCFFLSSFQKKQAEANSFIPSLRTQTSCCHCLLDFLVQAVNGGAVCTIIKSGQNMKHDTGTRLSIRRSIMVIEMQTKTLTNGRQIGWGEA